MTSLDGRARYSNQALPMIDEMQPGILKQMMPEKISDLTGLSLEQLSSVNTLQEATAVPPAATQGYYQETTGYSDDSYSDFQSPEYKGADYQNHDYQDHDYQNYDYQSGDFQSKGNKRKSGRKFGKDKRKPRPAPPGGSAVHINPSSSAVSILLHMPSLASQCGDLSFLKDSDNNTDQLLLHLSSHMLEHPGVTPGILAIDWQDEDHLRPLIHQLNEIAHQEPIIDSGNAQKVLQDCLIRLQERHLDREILKLKSQPHLSSDDKTRLNQLIMQQATSRIRKPTEK